MEAEQLQNKQIKWEQNPIKDIYLVKKSNKLLTYKKKKKTTCEIYLYSKSDDT